MAFVTAPADLTRPGTAPRTPAISLTAPSRLVGRAVCDPQLQKRRLEWEWGVSYGTNYTIGDRQQGTLSLFNSIFFFKSFLLADPYDNPRRQTSCYPFCIETDTEQRDKIMATFPVVLHCL